MNLDIQFPFVSRMTPHMPHFSDSFLNDSFVFSSNPIDGRFHLTRLALYLCLPHIIIFTK